MEVKIDDVKLISGSKVTVIGIVENVWFTVRDSHGRLGVCSEHDFDAEEDIKPQLSDLEIVQKAFECASLYHIKWDNPNQYFCLNTYESLLTWAKQTIGEG